MSNDRELLELAAKAAGIEVSDWIWRGDGSYFATLCDGDNTTFWDPLTDDGDALRLAVTLHIGTRSHGPGHWQQPNVSIALWDCGEQSGRVTVEHGDDPQRATRRAIVRAAAAIGRAMS